MTSNGKTLTQKPQEPDLIRTLKRMRHELTTLQAQVSDALTQAAALNLPEPHRSTCPDCQLTFPGPRRLAEHRYTQHTGPEPEHWIAAEQKAELES